MKLPTRFSLASLFFLVTLTAFGTVAYQYLTVSGHYKRNHDAKSIRYLLSRRSRQAIRLSESYLYWAPANSTTEASLRTRWNGKQGHTTINTSFRHYTPTDSEKATCSSTLLPSHTILMRCNSETADW